MTKEKAMAAGYACAVAHKCSMCPLAFEPESVTGECIAKMVSELMRIIEEET